MSLLSFFCKKIILKDIIGLVWAKDFFDFMSEGKFFFPISIVSLLQGRERVTDWASL